MSAHRINQLFATDQEIFDLIMSSPKRMSETTLLELLADRGIICSADTPRPELAMFLSSLLHDHRDLAGLVQKGEHGRRGERTTFFELQGELTPAEVKAAVAGYQEDVSHSETITVPTSTQKVIKVKLDYDEIDYSRTRLIQRQRRQADFDFRVGNGVTRVRMPATEKARMVAERLRDHVERARKAPLPVDEVSVADLTSPALRNEFFGRLIRQIPNCKFQMVTDAKVARWTADDADEDDLAAARREIVNQIESVSMRGKNIILTEQYQEFLKNGFFLTSITWRSEFLREPNDILQFEVAFEDGHAGTGFRYAARQSAKKEGGGSNGFSTVSETRKPSLFQAVEEAAREILRDIRIAMATGK